MNSQRQPRNERIIKTMAHKFGKVLFKLDGTGSAKKTALELLEKWSKIPHARWIPFRSLSVTGYGEMTARQAQWIVSQVYAKAKIQIQMILNET